MNRGAIPGYYFDEEKKKYFKIQKTQYAPKGAKYSYDNYKKETNAKNKRKHEQEEEHRRKRQVLARAPLLRNALATGIGALSETGLKGVSEILEIRSQAFVQGLEQRVLIDICDSQSATQSTNRLRNHESCREKQLPPPSEILSFEYDSATQGIILGTHVQLSRPVDSLVSVLPSEESLTRKPVYSLQNLRPMMVFPSEISSTTLTSQRNLMTTSRGATLPPDIHISTLLSPNHVQRTQPLDGPQSISMKPKKATTIWCSASLPSTLEASHETIALGTGMESGIQLLDNHRGSWKCHRTYQCDSDVLALSWLSPYVLTGGLRSGGVVLYDTRSRAGEQRFIHPSTITSIKSIDAGCRIVVAGLVNEMCVYDRRMLKEETKTISIGAGHWALPDDGWGGDDTGGNISWRAPFRKQVTCPRPVVRFKYNNEVRYPLGMDVSQELGLVAAGEEDGNVGVWSLRSGKRVRTLDTGAKTLVAARAELNYVKCLRFVQDEAGPPRLMGSSGSRIIEWTW